ncbi:MAG TPA: D-alanine--D-alanine ligase family protein [Candidatus Limnocylindria bacterium]|nr:D-alanine--D-alanine ligase family protein [Candidatus Limnocylindria bacterium]
MTRRLRIGIFAGGQSAEHEVSVSSAESVLRAIDRERYEPYLVYIDRDGRWHLPTGPAAELAGDGLAGLLGVDTPAAHTARLGGEASALPMVTERDALAPRAALRSLAEAIDVAFLVIHGPFGEDGTLQGFLELAGIPYTGAGVMASALAMDKIVFKDLMRGHDLPVVDFTWFRRSAWTDDPDAVLADVAARIGPRSVVKPARLGSSLGMSVVHDAGELPGAIEEALRYDGKVLVEAYLAGARELECGVLGNDQPVVFPPGEVRSHGEWYDYAAKYTEGLADVLPRADVDPGLAARLQQLALAAYTAVDAAGFARVDFLVPEGAVYISEMNTIPGFTATSMFPKQAELAGIGFGELIDRLIELGLDRARERSGGER